MNNIRKYLFFILCAMHFDIVFAAQHWRKGPQMFLNGLDLYIYHMAPFLIIIKSDLFVEYLLIMVPWVYQKSVGIHFTLHLSHLADALIQSDLQLVCHPAHPVFLYLKALIVSRSSSSVIWHESFYTDVNLTLLI
jgi:hypothetical protein